jgi:hypothetical protein
MKTLLRMLGLGLLISCVFSAPVTAMAGMYTAKYVDGSNVVVMANNVGTTQADVPVTYNLRVYDLEGKPLYFGNIDVQVKQGKKTIGRHNLRRGQNADASTMLTFPRQGTYLLVVRFLDNDKQVARGEFPVVAAASPNQSWFKALASWQTAVGFVVGVAVTSIAGLRRLELLEKIKLRFRAGKKIKKQGR